MIPLFTTICFGASENLEKNIKKNYNYNIKVYTFHKLALEILKEVFLKEKTVISIIKGNK